MIHPSKNNDLERIEAQTTEIDKLPSIYKKKCLWLIKMENDSAEELFYVTKTNRDRSADCYLRMNSLIQLLEKRGLL